MKLTQRGLRITSLIAAPAIFASSAAFAAGFEKSVIWSGKYAPIGGAASSSVLGAEALYFNPAGLVSGNDKKTEVTVNFTPIFGKFSGPITANNVTTDGSRSFVPSFGIFASHQLTEKWGLGIGLYASGGTKAVFDDVNFGNFGANTTPTVADVKAELSVVEASLGTAYEVLDGLRIGLAYRVVMVRAQLASAASATTNIQSVDIDNLTATRWNGFRLGIQYAPKESRWGLGANWRTQIGFVAESDTPTTGTITSVGGGGQQTFASGSTASVANTFPQQVDIGGHFEYMSGQRVFLQYTFTEYHKNQVLDIGGNVTLPTSPFLLTASGATINLPDILQNWKNIHNVRVGVECLTSDLWAYRFGYVLTTASTPKDYARATFSSPGIGNTFVLGVGKTLMDKSLELNGGVEYSWASGTVETSDNPATGILLGDYSSNNYSIHLGATYRL